MPLVDLDAIPQVPIDFVNADHREEARLLNELGVAVEAFRAGETDLAAVVACFETLYEHTREHFSREERAMQATGFPPFLVHQGEHQRVLGELAEEGRVFDESGDAARLWRYVSEAVPAWFTNHILTMDLVTARYVAAHGGEPRAP